GGATGGSAEAGLALLGHLLEPFLEFVVQRPHPFGRDLVGDEVLLPCQDGVGMVHGAHQIRWHVFYRLAPTRPEVLSVSAAAGSSDDGEESVGAGEPFPSATSTSSDS